MGSLTISFNILKEAVVLTYIQMPILALVYGSVDGFLLFFPSVYEVTLRQSNILSTTSISCTVRSAAGPTIGRALATDSLITYRKRYTMSHDIAHLVHEVNTEALVGIRDNMHIVVNVPVQLSPLASWQMIPKRCVQTSALEQELILRCLLAHHCL